MSVALPLTGEARRLNTKAITSLVYVSSATQLFSAEDLLDLLARARNNNGKLDITGMLLYKDGNFMQVLEGQTRLSTICL